MNAQALTKLSYGLYVVSSHKGDQLNGYIANTVFQVTAEPIMIAVCSNKQNLTTEYIRESGSLCISILSQEADLKFIGHFGFKSGREIHKFEGMNYRLGKTGAPVLLEKTVSFLEGNVTQEIDLGTHILFLCKLEDCDLIHPEAIPLTYQYYHEVIKGLSPKTAPTYIDKNKLK